MVLFLTESQARERELQVQGDVSVCIFMLIKNRRYYFPVMTFSSLLCERSRSR